MIETPTLLIVIPSYRESSRLPKYLDTLAPKFQSLLPDAKILVVDDGSGIVEVNNIDKYINSIRGEHSNILPLLALPKNLGKGGAILAAWDQNLGFDYLAFVDADGALPACEVCRLAKSLEPGGQGPALFSSRIKMLGKKVERTGLRHLSGRLFAFMVGSLIEPNIYDSQCGLKYIPTVIFQKIRPWLEGHRFAFDVELLAALRTVPHPILEVPVDWIDMPGSKVSLVRDTLRMFKSVILIRNKMKKWTL